MKCALTFLILAKSVLYKHVNAVAAALPNTFQDKQTYVSAAKNFRMPYWDWARNDVPTVFPAQAMNNTYPATPATGLPTQTYNPLCVFPFGKNTSVSQTDWNNITSVRY